MIELRVIGLPAPQGSKKFVGLSKAGHGVLVESSKAVKPWREAVKWAASEAGTKLAGPIRMVVTFTLPKPKSAPKTRRTWPDRKPDLSKLVRSTEDALTDAGIWEDDSRVVECVAAKVFPNEGQDALDRPGAIIKLGVIGE
jgi:Holliday junction resolvase RusA-like endonuclease